MCLFCLDLGYIMSQTWIFFCCIIVFLFWLLMHDFYLYLYLQRKLYKRISHRVEKETEKWKWDFLANKKAAIFSFGPQKRSKRLSVLAIRNT